MRHFATPSAITITRLLCACLLALVALVPPSASAELLSIPLREAPALTSAAQIFDPTIERQTGQICLCVPAEKVQSCELAAAFAIINDLKASWRAAGLRATSASPTGTRAAPSEPSASLTGLCFLDRDSSRADRSQCIIDRDNCRANC
ncbi:uncharacterized protein ACA1_376630 [Acanthamoeba castellanii str. Neff]|uniref:Uncharacterized protein n=1 Tax=Acanthamoeba castellanii (strain ATCC 30010 / Neff) TaxID=1257118 RepID=L8HGC4_ACACF|nr:uncharacterized protein ACA1_376630 [Acanthamoeba castellanii str. Neff]ELR24190.1 hypothetical protein ACA1_376630 [Acanthamoeba castellanii str. Neff]